ncbi:hypothetical protein VTI74DRAFT_5747 [Chaetomium olivicolor]
MMSMGKQSSNWAIEFNGDAEPRYQAANGAFCMSRVHRHSTGRTMGAVSVGKADRVLAPQCGISATVRSFWMGNCAAACPIRGREVPCSALGWPLLPNGMSGTVQTSIAVRVGFESKDRAARWTRVLAKIWPCCASDSKRAVFILVFSHCSGASEIQNGQARSSGPN